LITTRVDTTGDDTIPPIALKQCKFILARPLWLIFNKSLATGTFPCSWKSSLVTPIYKNGDASDVRNYRPISILNIMPRVFESIIVDKLIPLMSRHILEEQHGFMPNRFTVTNLSIFCSYISSALESFVQRDVIYTDFSKAFDSVDHDILLSKLEAFGIVGNLLSDPTYVQGRSL